MNWQDKALAAFWDPAFANETLNSHRRIEAAIAAAAASLLPPKDAPMTDHPITPPPELFKQWEGMPRSLAFEAAYRAGADQELDACCQYIGSDGKWFANPEHRLAELRNARRPKPPSLAEQALKALLHMDQGQHNERAMVVRRALEHLQELEGPNG